MLIVSFFFLLTINTTAFDIKVKKDQYFCDENISILGDTDLKKIQKEIIENDYSYTVDINPATEYSIDQLCGFKIPENLDENIYFEKNSSKDNFNTLENVPESYNWQDITLPKVKTQGECGSCWAFSTVGALECAIKRVHGEHVDLSEQYLVSCNLDNWGCGGGFFAHDYHYNKKGACDNEPGAVLEKDFEYTATNGECKKCNHPYKINGWSYVEGPQTVPSVKQIKNAIYKFGPVSAAVAVDSKFQAYSGGIFDSDTSTNVNHAIVLVGWKDDESVKNGGYWILRNSWGPGWGEGGYMRIAYNTNKVGCGACYIDYDSNSPSPPSDNDGYTIVVNIIEITNDPSKGYGMIDDPDDPDGGKPEWYYRIGFESKTSNNLMQNKNTAGGLLDWNSEHTWKVDKRHTFKSQDPNVKITFELRDRDGSGYDVADVSAVSTDSFFRGYFGCTKECFDMEKTNPLTKQEDSLAGGDIYFTEGDGKYNAKVIFSIDVINNQDEDIKIISKNNPLLAKILNLEIFSILAKSFFY